MIIEVLLGQDKIIEALRLAISLSGAENLSARKYLEAAKKKGDPIVFYTIYTWFQQRNIRQRGSPDFLRSNYLFSIPHNMLIVCNRWCHKNFILDAIGQTQYFVNNNKFFYNPFFFFCLQTNSVKNIRIIFRGFIVVEVFVSVVFLFLCMWLLLCILLNNRQCPMDRIQWWWSTSFNDWINDRF